MKTLNQVLLALLFAAFSSVGFAQNSTSPLQPTHVPMDRLHNEIMEWEEAEAEEEERSLHQEDTVIKTPCKYCFIDEEDEQNSPTDIAIPKEQ